MEIARGDQNQHPNRVLQLHTGLLDLVNPSKDNIFIVRLTFLNATATKQSPRELFCLVSSAWVKSSGWKKPLLFEPWVRSVSSYSTGA